MEVRFALSFGLVQSLYKIIVYLALEQAVDESNTTYILLNTSIHSYHKRFMKTLLQH